MLNSYPTSYIPGTFQNWIGGHFLCMRASDRPQLRVRDYAAENAIVLTWKGLLTLNGGYATSQWNADPLGGASLSVE